MGVLLIVHIIYRKTYLIRPHFIYQGYWLGLYLVHDSVITMRNVSQHSCPLLSNKVVVEVDEPLIRLGFSTRAFKRLFPLLRGYNFHLSCGTVHLCKGAR